MKNKYDFSLDHSDSRRDVEKYFQKHGWPKTLKRLIRVFGEIITQHTFEVDDKRDCTQYQFEQYFGSVRVLQDKLFPFKKDIHILY